MTHQKSYRIAVFIDAENVTNWSKPNLAMHQAVFELIHCYHPVTGKDTADIQMTVDVIECAWQLPNIICFVLVTGDSDFTPVFRRLQEMDKDVIGVGQHSRLSECVKTSCTRFSITSNMRLHAPMKRLLRNGWKIRTGNTFAAKNISNTRCLVTLNPSRNKILNR
jgi:hypothetical protein